MGRGMEEMPMERQFGAVIVAAGNSSRMREGSLEDTSVKMQAQGNKVFMRLCGKPVLRYSLEALAGADCIREIVVVCRPEDRGIAEQQGKGLAVPVKTVCGGRERQDSVQNGIDALAESCTHFVIHDGARPLVTAALVERVCADALQYGAAAAAVPVKDTCKLSENGFVSETPPRERLWAVQTPQAFERQLYQKAVCRAGAAGERFTDDCQLIEQAGGRVYLSEGDYRNLKLTTPEDMLSAQAFLRKGGAAMRIGYGYDVHQLTEGRRLILGGVEIPFEKGLLGHSDADVLTHAIADALLGAAGLGDIGKLFPDNDPAYAGADSLKLLSAVCRKLEDGGFSIGNIDATLVAQRPKVAAYIPEMCRKLAAACFVEEGRVSVKATTEEGLGFTGAGEGMAASAVCLLQE